MTEPEKAKAAGILFYSLPHELDYEMVDPLIRPICWKINDSGWVWTAESCQGHPDCTEEITAWGSNTDPMLRLVCRKYHFGDMMNLFIDSLRFDREGLDTATGFRCYPKVKYSYPDLIEKFPGYYDWEEVLVYLPGTNVATRNRSLKCLETFAEKVCKHVPLFKEEV
jgi:hypothetical protein